MVIMNRKIKEIFIETLIENIPTKLEVIERFDSGDCTLSDCYGCYYYDRYDQSCYNIDILLNRGECDAFERPDNTDVMFREVL